MGPRPQSAAAGGLGSANARTSERLPAYGSAMSERVIPPDGGAPTPQRAGSATNRQSTNATAAAASQMSMKAAMATLCILLFVAFVQSEDRPPYKDGDEVHGTKDLILVSKLKRNVIDLKQMLIWFSHHIPQLWNEQDLNENAASDPSRPSSGSRSSLGCACVPCRDLRPRHRHRRPRTLRHVVDLERLPGNGYAAHL